MSGVAMGFVIGGVLLLVGICVVGILAAIAIPAFIGYVKRTKTAEATSNLEALFTGASAYYAQEHVAAGMALGSAASACTVDPALTSNPPGPERRLLPPDGMPDSFDALGFAPADPLSYQYEIAGAPGRCGNAPRDDVYSLRAHGDLDGDGTQSLFELPIGSNEHGELVRAPAFYIENELE